MYCLRKCCFLRQINNSEKKEFENTNEKYIKEDSKDVVCAGVCVICPNGILVNQSHHLFWGLPKGLCETDECLIDCAVRELKEETGLHLDKKDLHSHVFSFRYSNLNRKIIIFFYITKKEIELCNSTNVFNDSTGYGFIKPLCFLELCYNGKLEINYYTRVLIKKIFNL
jgi:8-oxo-dGTP pyrophosphatase MutT (NUDIX family)